MKSNEIELIQILESTLRTLKLEESRIKEDVLLYEKKINNELVTLKQFVVNKPIVQQQRQKQQQLNKRKEEMDQKLENMIGQFNNQQKQIKQTKPVKKTAINQNSNIKQKEKGREVSLPKPMKKQQKKQEPRKPAEYPSIPKPKPEAVYLSNFHKPLDQIQIKQNKKQKVNIKQWIKQYKDEQLKNAQSERKARFSFLTTFSNYAPNRNKIIGQYTDKCPQRGWKGCSYSYTFCKFLQSINKEELTALFNSKVKVMELYKWVSIIKKLKSNFEILTKVRKNIKAPKKLNLKFQFNPLIQQNTNSQSNQKQIFHDLNYYLNSFYAKSIKILNSFLEKESLKRNDLKLLVEICNVILNKGKKYYTVIKYDQLSYMLNVIENGPERE